MSALADCDHRLLARQVAQRQGRPIRLQDDPILDAMNEAVLALCLEAVGLENLHAVCACFGRQSRIPRPAAASASQCVAPEQRDRQEGRILEGPSLATDRMRLRNGQWLSHPDPPLARWHRRPELIGMDNLGRVRPHPDDPIAGNAQMRETAQSLS
jgi:hypothetical protein